MPCFRPHAWPLSIVLVISLGNAAGEPDAAEVLRRFQTWLDGTRDLSGRFVQTLESGAIGEGMREAGTIALKRPGRIRWDYDEPDVKTALVVDGRTLLYLPEERQALRGRLDDDEGLLPALLAGEEPLSSLFDVTLVATPTRGGEGNYRIRLSPKRVSGSLEAAFLELKPPDFALAGARILDAAGNLNVFRFENWKRNRGLPSATFLFEPPPGTDTVDEEDL